MANKQPFYHDAQLLFTMSRPISQAQINKLQTTIVEAIYSLKGVVKEHPVELMFSEPEPGDPADLL